jgi:hypothetical protein
MAACSSLKVSLRFDGICRFHLQGEKIQGRNIIRHVAVFFYTSYEQASFTASLSGGFDMMDIRTPRVYNVIVGPLRLQT